MIANSERQLEYHCDWCGFTYWDHPAIRNCPICDSVNFKPTFKGKGWLLQYRIEDWHLAFCRNHPFINIDVILASIGFSFMILGMLNLMPFVLNIAEYPTDYKSAIDFLLHGRLDGFTAFIAHPLMFTFIGACLFFIPISMRYKAHKTKGK